jgi:hypothetical protein
MNTLSETPYLMQEQQLACVARSVGDWTVLKSGRRV